MKRSGQLKLTLVASLAALFAAPQAEAMPPLSSAPSPLSTSPCIDQYGRLIHSLYCDGNPGLLASGHFYYFGAKPRHPFGTGTSPASGVTGAASGQNASTTRGIVGQSGGTHAAAASAGHRHAAGS